MYVYAPHVYLVPTEVRKEHQIPWNWSFGYLGATMWGFGVSPGCNARDSGALDCWVISSWKSFLLWGWRRWFSGWEHIWFLQRIWVPSPSGKKLITTWDSRVVNLTPLVSLTPWGTCIYVHILTLRHFIHISKNNRNESLIKSHFY